MLLKVPAMSSLTDGYTQLSGPAAESPTAARDFLQRLIADAETDRLLGMHILGPQASHLIAEGVLAIEFAASAEDIARTIHAHPSLSEVVKEAAWAIPQH